MALTGHHGGAVDEPDTAGEPAGHRN